MARFFDAPPWRFVVTRLDGSTLTFLDPLALNRTVTYTLNAPAVATMDVPSDNPEVNTLAGDGDPFVAMGNRLIYGFRRDGSYPNPPWTCRFGGILMQPNDEINATVDAPISHLTAYDPWQYLKSRPVLTNELNGGVPGLLPGPQGVSYSDEPQNIVKDLLVNTIIGGPPGGPTAASECFIDYGQTPYYEGNLGTVHITPQLAINFTQGTSLADAFTQIVTTGACDIVLTPIYDPIRRPGFLAEISVYLLAGSMKPDAVFSWDKPGRSLIGHNRLKDGGQLLNVAQFYVGTGGSPVPQPTGPIVAASIAKYGPYWFQKFITGANALDPNTAEYVALLAAAAVAQQNNGKEVTSCDPAPEFAPLLFDEYFLGDQVPVYASKNFRQAINPTLTSGGWTDFYRVYSIPVSIPDNAPENVAGLLLSSPFTV